MGGPIGSGNEAQGAYTFPVASAEEQLSPAEKLALLTEALASIDDTAQEHVNKLHKELTECMEDPRGNLLEVLEKILRSADEISTTHLRDLHGHLSACLTRAPPGMQGAHLRRALERHLNEGGHSEDWIRAKFGDVAKRVSGAVRGIVNSSPTTVPLAQAQDTASSSGGLSHDKAKVGRQQRSPRKSLQVTPANRTRWYAAFRAAARPSIQLAAINIAQYGLYALSRARQGPRTKPTGHTPATSHALQVQNERFGYSSRRRSISRILHHTQSQKPLHPADHPPVLPSSEKSLISCSHLNLRKVSYHLHMAHLFRQRRGTVSAGVTSLKAMPPRWRTDRNGTPAKSVLSSSFKLNTSAPPLVESPGVPQHTAFPPRAMHVSKLSQVRTVATLCTALIVRGDKAGQLPASMPASLLTDPDLDPFRLLGARVGSSARPETPKLSACAGDLASSKLSVVFHTARIVVGSVSARMPSPSAKLKASRRLPKRLRITGEQPTGDLARSRAEAAERHARGESNTTGQHSCHQGKRSSEDKETSHSEWWYSSWGWHEGWRSDNWSSGWHSGTASGPNDALTTRPRPPKPPSPRWSLKAETSDKHELIPTDSATMPGVEGHLLVKDEPTQTAETAVEPEHGQTSPKMTETEVEVDILASGKDPPGSPAAARETEGQEAEHTKASTEQMGSRLSAPSSDSEELVPVETDTEIATAHRDERCPATNSDSEELFI